MKKAIVLFGMLVMTAIAGKAQDTQAEFKFEKDTISFGTIKQGDVVNRDFKFVNAGKDNLIITGASGSCGCTVPDYPKEPIKPGATGIIKVTFNSAGKSGAQTKTVTLSSNAKGGSKVLYIKGNVDVKTEPAPTTTPAQAPVEHK